MKKLGKIIFWVVVVLTLVALFFVLQMTFESKVKKVSDAKQINDLKQIQVALELYHNEFGLYPSVERVHPVDRFKKLETFLVPKFIEAISDYQQYDYKSSPDGKSYVLKAILQGAGLRVLEGEEDKDGDIYGVWCGEGGNETEYCLGL